MAKLNREPFVPPGADAGGWVGASSADTYSGSDGGTVSEASLAVFGSTNIDLTTVTETMSGDAGDVPWSETPEADEGPVLEVTAYHADVAESFDSMDQSILGQLFDGGNVGGGGATPFGFLGAVGAIADTNIVDVTVNQMYTNGGLLPLTGAERFFVFVNGIMRPILRASRRAGDSHYDLRTIRIILAYPVRRGDIIEVTYIGDPSSDSRVRDRATPANDLPSFSELLALNMTPGDLHTIFEWIEGEYDEPFGPEGDDVDLSFRLLEHRYGFPEASIILDTVAPEGVAIINESPAAGGIHVHLLEAFNGSTEVEGRNLMQDMLGYTARVAGTLGGKDDESEYETFGTGGILSICKLFHKDDSGAYPLVDKVRFCCTASKAKAFVVEVKKQLTHLWTPIFLMIADDRTIEYFSVKLASAVRLAGVRLRHVGDYYTTESRGDLTLACADEVSGVEAMQISHYSDMRDAGDFPGSDAAGWVDFEQGTSVFDWDLVNRDRVWMHEPGIAGAGFVTTAFAGSTLLFIGATTVSRRDSTGRLETIYTLPSGSIRCATTHRGRAYIGTSTGKVLASSNGTSFDELNTDTPMSAIGAMTSYGGALWVGTIRDGDDTARVYSYDGTSFSLRRSFESLDVTAMEHTSKYLFVGFAGDEGRRGGLIYLYDGTEWALTRDTSSDGVQAIGFATSLLWVGVEGGILHTLSFDTDGTLKTWDVPPQASDAGTFTSIRGSSDGTIAWFNTDSGLLVYYAALSLFTTIDGPPLYTGGITAVYTESDASDYKNVGQTVSGGTQATATETSINSDDLVERAASLTPAVDSTYFNVSWSGFIRADYTGEHAFELEGADGARMFLGGEDINPGWEGGDTVVNNWDAPVAEAVEGVFDLISGQLVAIRVEEYTDGGGASLVLRWKRPGDASSEVVPAYALFESSTASERAQTVDCAEIDGTAYFAATDGRVYTLDTDPIISRRRYVYARFRDRAGNITATDSLGNVNTAQLVNDEIVQDAEMRSGIRVSDGKIYQVDQDKTVVASFTSQSRGELYAPNRKIRVNGIFDSVPFYVAALTRWDKISFLATLPAGSLQGDGLDSGVEVRVYVKTAATRDALLAADWGEPFDKSTIPPDADSGLVNTALTGEFNIFQHTEKWIMFRLELVTAQKGVAPTVHAVTLSYMAANASYFFTKMLDTADESDSSPLPTFRRGLLTTNKLENGGMVRFGYTTSENSGDTFDFSQYTEITPNRVFALDRPSEKLRFGIMIVSLSDSAPAVVDEFAVQLDPGDEDIKLMD